MSTRKSYEAITSENVEKKTYTEQRFMEAEQEFEKTLAISILNKNLF